MTPTQALAHAKEATQRHDFRVADVEGTLARNQDGQVVGIRGTETRLVSQFGLWDVLRDLRALPWYDKRVGWSHAGFLKGARGIVDRALYGLLSRDAPVYLVGHSMGGAIAINAAAILHAEGFDVRGATTFGAPRTLRRAYLPCPCEQYVNPGDPVADVPPRWLGYRHVNEIMTRRPRQFLNHSLECYEEALI